VNYLYRALLAIGILIFIIPIIINTVYLINPDFELLNILEGYFPILKNFHTNSLSTKADVFVLIPAMLLAIGITIAGYERGRLLLLQVIFIKLIFDLLITPIIILRAPQLLISEYILLLIPYFLWYIATGVGTAIMIWVKEPFPEEGFKGTIVGDIDYGIVETPGFFTGNIKEVYFRNSK
jgi:hypothetical protein